MVDVIDQAPSLPAWVVADQSPAGPPPSGRLGEVMSENG